MTDEPTLTLYSDGLLSKWGFRDGDIPDEVFDYCDANGLSFPADWRHTLVRLVREFLLPVLAQDVQVYEIGGNHNPIRAETVDGVGIDCRAIDQPVRLTPTEINIPLSVVASFAMQKREQLAQ